MSQVKSARLLGWSATIAAFVGSYLLWTIGQNWWLPSVAITGTAIAAICALNCYLAHTTKKYDLYIAALLSALSPVLIITIAFGFFFSGPPT
ncbi:hypothetical protein [Corynebacterium propinquum]|uniref:hypothetical protein n=1 Tax=Corynebacterium propinquum TaxID=43769 RepID=UPI00191EEC2E|nr:hypothetical protein [Corynebacterium propinquum]MCG7232278.1 DUF4407 domain-containing protein [Corynebacterium propinquum]QQU86405.1 hypothetical protein I6I70_01475 [Corynebacterium propinquum]WKS27575.1 DUF4407 domain-containing protein [Corynebacterium propinquum]